MKAATHIFRIERRVFGFWWVRQRHSNAHDAYEALHWCEARFPYQYRLVMEKIR